MQDRCVPGTQIERPRVALVGQNANAYAIIARVSLALRRAGVPANVVSEYRELSTSGNYDNVLVVAQRYCEESGP